MIIENTWDPHTLQKVFRKLLLATSRPGTIVDLYPECVPGKAHLNVLACLIDGQISFCDLHRKLDEDEAKFLGLKQADPNNAQYLYAQGSITVDPSFEPRLGELSHPEGGATIILSVDSVGEGNQTLNLTGPGIPETIEVNISGLHDSWLTNRESWVCDFPLGLEYILVDDQRILCLPRTTILQSA